MARPTELTDEVRTKIVQAIIDGNYFETACRYAGISPESGYEWMRRGLGRDRRRPRSELYAQFAQAVRAADAQMEVGIVAQIRTDIAQTPKLGLDFLARRFPDRWANRDKLDVGGTGKEIVFRVTYGDPAENRNTRPAPQATCQAGRVPSE